MSVTNRGDPPEPLLPPSIETERLPLGSRALRAALQAQLRQHHASESPELRRLAVLLCAEAHRRSLRVEQLVVILKQTWLSLPESAQPSRAAHVTLVERLISLCIEEFFRGAPRAEPGTD